MALGLKRPEDKHKTEAAPQRKILKETKAKLVKVVESQKETHRMSWGKRSVINSIWIFFFLKKRESILETIAKFREREDL